ncbi:unnamed protein product [Pleuronectes platessa]|uniref:Uncharacterized protein n=1 Tax=Pleuronectes platessa TaxID=8262 RepID=A0A9N7VNH0_PLEPL|nr:unnamed protein product [Pleuronectes platessa]
MQHKSKREQARDNPVKTEQGSGNQSKANKTDKGQAEEESKAKAGRSRRRSGSKGMMTLTDGFDFGDVKRRMDPHRPGEGKANCSRHSEEPGCGVSWPLAGTGQRRVGAPNGPATRHRRRQTLFTGARAPLWICGAWTKRSSRVPEEVTEELKEKVKERGMFDEHEQRLSAAECRGEEQIEGRRVELALRDDTDR